LHREFLSSLGGPRPCMKYLITGANGFLGSAIVDRLQLEDDAELHLAVRRFDHEVLERVSVHSGLDLQDLDSWDMALFDVDIVIHAAARVHVMADAAIDPLHEYYVLNTMATQELAKKSAAAGVKRFIYISTIKVNGDQTLGGRKFTPEDIPNPSDDYAKSKHEAEECLMRISKESKMEVVIVRPVLVYGPGVKGNFLSLINFIYKEIPIPLGLVKNFRSIVAIDNLVDFILRCSQHPAAVNQIFLISDGEDLSTPQLINRISFAMGIKSKLVKIPLWLLVTSLKLIRKERYSKRLLNSLQVDISKSRQLLGWKPPATIDESLAKTIKEYKRLRDKKL
jgi:nucleoside-diphosphate-sugar epimerase